jgi:hypothetical protein
LKEDLLDTIQNGIELNGFSEQYSQQNEKDEKGTAKADSRSVTETSRRDEPIKVGVAVVFGSQLFYGIFSLGAMVVLLVLLSIFLLIYFRRRLLRWMRIPSSEGFFGQAGNKFGNRGGRNSRLAENGTLTPSDQVEMRGALKKIRFPDLLQLLASCENTGSLVVQNKHEQKSLTIRRGKICSASCQDKDKKNKLGYLLVKLGKITKSERRRALALCAEDPSKRLGQALIEIGAIDWEGLREVLQVQAEEIVYSLMAFPEGHFEFVNERPQVNSKEELSLDVMDLVMEAARREDEWEHMREALPSMDVVLDFAEDDVLSINGAALSDEEQMILGLVDGEHTISEICVRTPLVDFDVCRFLYRMIREGVLRKSNMPLEETV